MIFVTCKRCKEYLTEPGALAFGPPTEDDDQVVKYHLCLSCWIDLLKWIGR